ncbi:MAG: biopolymer transporter ExbD [Verrucomicrobiae bacterium]|nr:biopolymer transporter ExbD [Verrucomicrobiae bacterium]
MRKVRARAHAGHGTLTDINVTPLLDLAFVLLIIFIITTPLIEKSVEISIPTSDSRAAQSIDPREINYIEMDKAGRIVFGKERVDPAQLTQKLRVLRERNAEATVLLRGDKTASLQDVTQVIDAVQNAGITRFGIVTTPEK